METAPRRALTELLKVCFEEAGFGYEEARVPVEQPYAWWRPPLLTPLRLSGQPLQPHLAVPCKLDVEDLADAYERFVSGALRRRTYHSVDINYWFMCELRLTAQQSRALFVPPAFGEMRRGFHLNLVQYAALVYYNVESHLEAGPSTFVVTAERSGFQFGIRNGRLVSNLKRAFTPIRVRGLDSLTGNLEDLARGEPATPKETTLFDHARRWLETAGVEDFEGFELALRILWWRGGGRFPARLLSLTFADQSKAALKRALEEARQFDRYEAPLACLRDIFVPQFMTFQHFVKLFGNPHQAAAVTPMLRRKWTKVLDELEPGPFEVCQQQ